MEQRKWGLDSWDALVKKAIDSLQLPFFLRETDQRFSQGNRLVHTIMAMFQASNPQG